MKVYKFGGGAIREASDIRKLASIIKRQSEPIFIIISALKKTTNALEELTELYINKENYELKLQKIYDFHFSISLELFPSDHFVFDQINEIFKNLNKFLNTNKSDHFPFIYDQIVSFGEILATRIISEYLNFIGIQNTYLDVKNYIQTDNNYKQAQVNWSETQSRISNLNQNKTYITQGFIGADNEGFTTTLGRESSDYSASIFAYCWDAESLTLWKDVPGILNADPKEFKALSPKLISFLSYKKAFELASYGASLIHPNTLGPLEEKKIKLYIRSFLEDPKEGTLISNEKELDTNFNCYTVKKNQILFSFSKEKKFFFDKNQNYEIFSIFWEFSIQINLIQASLVNLYIVVEDRFNQLENCLNLFRNPDKIEILENVSLYTIFSHDPNSIKDIKTIIGEEKKVLLSQSNLEKTQWVVKN